MAQFSTDDLRGSFPPVVTPFTAEGAVDLDRFSALVDQQVAAGSHGIVVNGTTAEPSTLTVAERMALAERGVAAAAGRVPVMVATGSQSLSESVELTAHADRIGADAVLVVTPYYSRPMQRGLIEYFCEIGSHTDLPLLMYHIPGRTGVEVTVSTIETISQRVSHFVGMKHASADLGLVSDVISALGPDFRVFVGLEELSLPMLVLGAAGMVNAVANIAPRWVAALYDAVVIGDLDAARARHYDLLELNRSIFFETNPIPLKYMMKRVGSLDGNHHRLPITPASRDVEIRCDDVLTKAGLV